MSGFLAFYPEEGGTAEGTNTDRAAVRAARCGRQIAQHRLSVLDLARALGDAADARRQRGRDRTSFYERKRRFQTQGFPSTTALDLSDAVEPTNGDVRVVQLKAGLTPQENISILRMLT